MGLSPDTPLAYFWSWGRALHIMDGPDEVHRRTIARTDLARARDRAGSSSAWFTTPEQLADALDACTTLHPVYRRLLALTLEELRVLEAHLGQP